MLPTILLFVFLVGVGVGSSSSVLDEAQAEIAVLLERLAEVETDLDAARELQANHAALTGELAIRDEQIERLGEALQVAEADLEAARTEVAEARSASPGRNVEELDARIEELSIALDEAQSRVATAEELADWERVLEQRTAELDRREVSLSQQTPAPRKDPPPASGCAAGQVNVNTASVSELQRIHQVGPARAEQIVALRPFLSVDDLTRVSGIGPAHLSAIKGQGLACVD